jgi:hypothetical protein
MCIELLAGDYLFELVGKYQARNLDNIGGKLQILPDVFVEILKQSARLVSSSESICRRCNDCVHLYALSCIFVCMCIIFDLYRLSHHSNWQNSIFDYFIIDKISAVSIA